MYNEQCQHTEVCLIYVTNYTSLYSTGFCIGCRLYMTVLQARKRSTLEIQSLWKLYKAVDNIISTFWVDDLNLVFITWRNCHFSENPKSKIRAQMLSVQEFLKYRPPTFHFFAPVAFGASAYHIFTQVLRKVRVSVRVTYITSQDIYIRLNFSPQYIKVCV